MAKKGHFLLGLVVGSVAAASATLLLTPETSADLKAKITGKYGKTKDRALELYQLADDATADWREAAATKVDRVLHEHEGLQTAVSSSSDKLQQLKDNFQGATGQMRNQLDDVSRQLKSSFEETKDAADFDDIILDTPSAFAEAETDSNSESVLTSESEVAENQTDKSESADEDVPTERFSFDETDPKLDATSTDK